MRPSLPTRPSPIRPGKTTPAGDAEPYGPQYEAPGPPTVAPGSESGNAQYSPIFVTDDGDNTAPVDDGDNVTGVGYQS
jgi:hypothetical protein